MKRLLGPFVVLLAGALVSCSPAQTAPPPAQPESVALRTTPEFAPGTKLFVERAGQWLPASVVGRVGLDRFRIHYEGYGSEWDEVVGPDRIHFVEVIPAADYRVGDKVIVAAQGKQFLGDIVQQVGPAEWRVHYDGFGPEVAENVKPDRLQRPFAGVTAHIPGEAVVIDVGGRPLAAKVLVPLAADRWLVRFDGFGPEYDQEVSAERLKPAGVSPPAPSAPASTTEAKTPSMANTTEASFRANDAVYIANRGVYHPAVVVGPGRAGHWRVKYTSGVVTSSDGDTEVLEKLVHRAVMPDKGERYSVNQNVFVEWHGLYFAGRVVKTGPDGQVRIRFDNFGPEADEIIPTRRLRPRP